MQVCVSSSLVMFGHVWSRLGIGHGWLWLVIPACHPAPSTQHHPPLPHTLRATIHPRYTPPATIHPPTLEDLSRLRFPAGLALDGCTSLLVKQLRSPAAKEGTRCFVEKQAPRWAAPGTPANYWAAQDDPM